MTGSCALATGRSRVALLLAWALACHSAGQPVGAYPSEEERWVEPAALQGGAAEVVEVREQELPDTVLAAGKIAFEDQRVAHVFAPVAGRITRVLAALGQRVEKGAPLVALASPEAGSAFSDVAKAEADFAQATAELGRQERLTALGAAPRRDLEVAQDAHRKAEAELARARQRATLLRGSGLDSGTQELVLRSPLRGEVMARAAVPGVDIQGASTGTPVELVTVGDIARVWVIADVAEPDMPRVRLGATATVRVAAWPGRTFRASVELIGTTLDPATRTGRLRLSLENRDRALKPEMLAQVTIEAPPRRGLGVSQRAITRIEGAAYVYCAAGELADGRLRFKRRRIHADEGEPLALVTAGLTAGERVLVEKPKASHGSNGEARVSEAQGRAIGLRTAPASEQEVSGAVGFGGRTAFDDVRVARVFSPVTGRVAHVLAAPGERVHKGSPLLTLVSPDVGAAFAEAMKAQAELVASRHERDRQRELVAAHAGAPRDLEVAEASWRKAAAEVERADQKLRLLSAGTFDRVTQEYTLRSPIDGEVIARAAAPGLEVQGQWAGSGAPVELFTVGELDPLWILGDVYEMDLPHVRRGDAVTVQVPALPDRVFHGKVDWVGDVLDPILRTGKIRCVIENRDRALRPEMAPVLTVTLPPRRQIAVPRQAVVRLGDETVLFVAAGRGNDGELIFKRRRVVVGEEGAAGLVPILEGIASGESVVTRGAIFLTGLL